MKAFKNTYNILLVLLTLLTVNACTDIVDVELNPENLDLIAVEAYLNTYEQNNVYVKLERSLPVNEADANPAINDALVEIFDDEQFPNKVTLEEYENTGIYILPWQQTYPAIAGRTYNLKITLTDGTIIEASDYLQKVEQLDTVRVNLSARGDYEYLAIFINSQETPGEGHYYKWDIYINNQLLYESDEITFASDELVDGNYIYDFEIYTDWWDEEEDKVMDLGDTIRVEQLSISRPIYDFYLGMVNQAWAGGPFSVPPANVPSNLISNDEKKVLGMFSARDISIGNIVVIDSTNFEPLTSSIEF